MKSLSWASRRALFGAATFTAFAALAACGSRTGLFGPDLTDLVDAEADVNGIGNGEGGLDSGKDTSVDAPIDGPIPCMPGTFDFQLATAQLMFVLDRSGSMAFGLGSDTPPTPPLPTRWRALHDALSGAIVPFDNQIQMGAKFFPEATADQFDPVGACLLMSGVGISPALGNANAILNTFNTTSPKGGTPTALAITYAGQFLAAARGVARTMVVATDGAPNCNGSLNGRTCQCTVTPASQCVDDPQGGYDCLDDNATVGAITDLFQNRKIPVYVVGIGGGSFAGVLDSMAVAGGRANSTEPKYLPGDTPAQMQTAFSTVRDSVAKCTYLTPSAPTDPDSIIVDVAGVPVARDTTHVNGWDWSDQEYGVLELFGDACNTATAMNVSGTITCRDD
ncbi:MAG TPA: hypothetical protein VIF62_23140 [Labilithrix sp.]